MNIEIVGVGPSNKGAELMLQAILARVGHDYPDSQFVVDPSMGPYSWRSSYGLHQRFSPENSGRLGSILRRVVTRDYRYLYGLVPAQEIGVVLGAEGYAYGDPWNPDWVEASAKRYELAKANDQAVVLLPQAFGPFENERVRSATKRILDCADLVFARDSTSLEHVLSISSNAEVQLAPDFTNLLPGKDPARWRRSEKAVAIVPNQKMLVHAGADGEEYEQLLLDAIRTAESLELDPFLLVHEATSDTRLAQRLAEQGSDGGLDVFVHDDPAVLKGVLGACLLTVGSRFHGLVSALSQGVPSIGTSWSHKYEHLFADYGVSHLLLGDETIGDLMKRLAEQSEHERIAQVIKTHGETQKKLAADMWDTVARVLR